MDIGQVNGGVWGGYLGREEKNVQYITVIESEAMSGGLGTHVVIHNAHLPVLLWPPAWAQDPLCEFESLRNLKTILEQFAAFSGLKCNSEKTVLMQVGRKVVLDENILSLGFNISDNIHILGMTIDSELESLDENFEKTLSGLRKSVEFW